MTGPQRLVATFAVVVIATETVLAVLFSERQLVAPTPLFCLVVVAASLCVVAALALMAVALNNEQPELGFVSLFFLAVSILPLVHGLTTPGVLYGANSATAAAAFWGVPVGVAAASPCLLGSTSSGRWIARRWRRWALAWGVAMVGLATVMLAAPELVPVPTMGSPLAIAVAALALGSCVLLAHRHARLAQIAHHNGPLVVSLGYVLVGTSALVFISGPPYAPHFWLGHGVDIAGVFLATIGGVVVYIRSGAPRAILAPVVAFDPHSALEVGLSPLVRDFVADLYRKDELTRDHVVRCASLAIHLAQRVGLPPARVREAGLVGLLHDVGKLEIPDDILKKPGRLTQSEFAVIQTHTTHGYRMLRDAPGLESLAPAVRAHHEQIDGAGYPLGMRGSQIPVLARLVAVCDAHDAMTIDRPYRPGMDPVRARAILCEHAGSQWDEELVRELVTLTLRDDRIATTPRLNSVGREGHPEEHPLGCGCLPALVDTS